MRKSYELARLNQELLMSEQTQTEATWIADWSQSNSPCKSCMSQWFSVWPLANGLVLVCSSVYSAGKLGLKKKNQRSSRSWPKTRCQAWTKPFQVNKLFLNSYDNTKCSAYLMLYFIYLLLDPSPFTPRGWIWWQLRGGIWCQINSEGHQSLQGVSDCQRQHCDNSKSHPDFQHSSRLRLRLRPNGFLLCGSYWETQESPWSGLCGTGEAPQAPQGKVSHWVGLDLGNCSQGFCQVTGHFLLLTPKQLRLNDLPAHCRSHLLVLERAWGHIPEAREKRVVGLGFEVGWGLFFFSFVLVGVFCVWLWFTAKVH